MMDVSPRSFAELVGFDPTKLGAAPDETHGTTVLALRFSEGVIVLADRRATMGNLIMYDQAEKIEALDDATLVAISGAYGRSIEVCRYLRHAFKYYERMNLEPLSTDGKLMEISRALAANVSMAMQGIGVFIPIVAAYDGRADRFVISFFDAAGARFQSANYASAGSGSERIRGVFEYVTRTKTDWSKRGREEVLLEGLQMLDIASDLDSATGGLRQVMPSVSVLTRDGVSVVPPESLRPMVERVLRP